MSSRRPSFASHVRKLLQTSTWRTNSELKVNNNLRTLRYMLLPSLMLLGYILLCKLGSGSCLNMLKINSNHLIRSLLTSTFSLFLCPSPSFSLLLSPSLSPRGVAITVCIHLVSSTIKQTKELAIMAHLGMILLVMMQLCPMKHSSIDGLYQRL